MNITDTVKKGFYLECIAAIRQGDSVHVADSSGFTPLHWAAIQGFPGFIDLLLDSGADINVKSKKFGLTPLHLATIRNKIDCMHILLKKGANIEAKSILGDTPLNIAIKRQSACDTVMPFSIYSKQMNFQVGAEPLSNQNAYEIHEDCEVGEGNNPENASMKSILTDKSLLDKDKAMNAIYTLLNFDAQVSDPSSLTFFVLESIVRDNLEGIKIAVEKGVDLTSFNRKTFDQTGFHYIVLLAASHFAYQTLQWLICAQPSFMVSQLPKDSLLYSNLVNRICQQLPPNTVLAGPREFLELPQVKGTRIGALYSALPNGLKDCEVCFKFDTRKERYYISKLIIGFCTIPFDKEGNIQQIEYIKSRIYLTLKLLKESGEDFNYVDNIQDRASKFLAKCHTELIKLFLSFGMQFTHFDFHQTIVHNSYDSIKLLFDSGASISWRNPDTGLNALDIVIRKENPNLTKEDYTTLLLLFNQRKGEHNNSAESVKSYISNSLILTYAQLSAQDRMEKLRDSKKAICKMHVKIA